MKVVVIVADLAPYHIARYRAVVKIVSSIDLLLVDCGRASRVAYERPEQFNDVNYISVSSSNLRKVLIDSDLDVLVVPGWSGRNICRATAWAFSQGIPVVVMSDSQLEGLSRSLFKDLFKKLLIPAYSAALVAGKRAQRYMESFGFPADCIFHGVDVVDNEHFSGNKCDLSPLPHELRGRQYMLSVGRLVEQKNYRILLDAYASYLQEIDDRRKALELVIVGEGHLGQNLMRYAEDKKVNTCVHFIGSIAYSDLPGIYSGATFFILASNVASETWGLVVNEAMAAGLPLLVSRQSGASDDLVFNGINGYSFDGDDAQELCRCILRLDSQPEMRKKMGVASKQIISKWSLKLFAESFYNACLCAQRTSPYKNRIIASLLLRILS